MSESIEELDLLIDEYLDGRMDVVQRVQFEERMNREPELRQKVLSATQSVNMVQNALGWVTPGDEFENKVNEQITHITQSGFNFKPAAGTKAPNHKLTQNDPDAKMLADPEAALEKKRLIIIGGIAVIVFALVVAGVIYVLSSRSQRSQPEKSVPAIPAPKE